jgi:hypothetical protein
MQRPDSFGQATIVKIIREVDAMFLRSVNLPIA